MNYKERLREYIENDEIYTEYKSGKMVMSDFDKFCIEHCKDIESLLNEVQEYKDVIDKAIEYINLIVLSETLNGEPVLFKEEAEGQYLLDILNEVK